MTIQNWFKHQPVIADSDPPRTSIRPGQKVRWNPPPGAYSPQTKQARLTGQTGRALPHDPGSYIPVRFEKFTLLLNADYLEAA